jgi:hypothetical protein
MEQRINSNRLDHIARGAWRSACLAAAIELELFEHLKDGI